MSGYKVIDVFAGPGGLNEGFASLDRGRAFNIAGSFEMEPSAVRTLTTRAAQRLLEGGAGEKVHRRLLRGEISHDDFAAHGDVACAWEQAAGHVHEIELGRPTRPQSDALIEAALEGEHEGRWVLIGGPPCQAYSMVGRSRRRHDKAFEDDVKHFLYREYLHIIQRFRPAVFVMENVKGMLSTTHGGRQLFQQIETDLQYLGGGTQEYHLRSLAVSDRKVRDAADFIVRAERYGVPQARHRVILVGVRTDLHKAVGDAWIPLTRSDDTVTLEDALADLPPLRSRLSPRRDDSPEAWAEVRAEAFRSAGRSLPTEVPEYGGAWVPADSYAEARPQAKKLLEWLRRTDEGYAQHETRAHMESDLMRYAYLAHLAEGDERPRVQDLPKQLLPSHKNLKGDETPFSDRFRVQRWGHPSSTVVAHLAKDGHYFIHPDPAQMRSITVREAARLQTFPDDYFFAGNRTQQYQQVGNAVPPFLARQIAERVVDLMRAGDTTVWGDPDDAEPVGGGLR